MRATHATPDLCLADLPRLALAAMAEAIIDELDRRDGDPDLEDSDEDFAEERELEDFI